jgi:hypothetical protein
LEACSLVPNKTTKAKAKAKAKKRNVQTIFFILAWIKKNKQTKLWNCSGRQHEIFHSRPALLGLANKLRSSTINEFYCCKEAQSREQEASSAESDLT